MINKKTIFRILWGVGAVVLVTAMAVGDVIYSKNQTQIIGYLVPPIANKSGSTGDAKASGNALAEKIVGEGSVLVKNNGTLPLSKESTTKINLLGFSSVQWIYGGSGSGQVTPPDGNWDGDETIDLIKAFKNYGIETNSALTDYYKKYAPISHNNGTLNFNFDTNPYGFGLKEPSVSDSSYKALLDDSKNFSDTAVVVIGRQGGESEDFPKTQFKSKPTQTEDKSRHSLQISTEEEDLLKYAGQNYKNTIVIINSTNPFQLDFLDSINGLDSCLVVGTTGLKGANAIPKLVYGEINPSGRLADTLSYDFKSDINTNYFGYDGVSFYKNSKNVFGQTTNNSGYSNPSGLSYVDYAEGIYVGYRWYETAAVMGTFDGKTRQGLSDNDTEVTRKDYDAVVQYPFGYGLSYTDFTWDVLSVKDKDGKDVKDGYALSADTEVNLQVRVTNTGKVVGKDVVELYEVPPYYVGGIEKSAVNLVDFAKTSDIQPGANEVVTLTAKARDLASFDTYDLNKNGKSTYELDKGTYKLQLMDNAHTVAKVNFIGGTSNVDGVISLDAANDVILDKDPYTGTEIKPLFSGDTAMDGYSIDGNNAAAGNANIPYISRKDFKGLQYPLTKPTTARDMTQQMSDSIFWAGTNGDDYNKNASAWDKKTTDEFGDRIPSYGGKWGQAGDLKIAENGKPTDLGMKLGQPENFNDPQWDKLLDQVTYQEATSMVSYGHPYIQPLNSIGMPKLYNLDGPAQMAGYPGNQKDNMGVGFPGATTLGQTWNKTLAYEYGLAMGEEMNNHGETGYYGPAMNIHRNPFEGRSFEYISEDPRLSGKIAANLVKGGRDSGHTAFIKHFAVAEDETTRVSLYTWLTEQSLREIYLEPFRMAVEEGQANALMTSFNRIGATWVGGSVGLMQGVLRREWGFKGMIITDYAESPSYMNMDQTLRQGGTLGMATGLKFDYSEKASKRARQALRNAIKNNVYSWLNSQYSLQEYNKNPYNGKTIEAVTLTFQFDWVTPLLIDVNVVLGAAALGFLYFGVAYDFLPWNKGKKDKKEGK